METSTKKKRKWLFFVVLALIIAGLYIFRGWITVSLREYMAAKRLNEEIKNIPPETTYVDHSVSEEYYNNLKEEESDIPGMTRYDKASAGLEISDDSDTDADGLTDREEIEKYGTDPLKCSTAGDLYSDSYKVKNGMDPHEAYEYDGDPTICDEDCNVFLYAKTPYDIGNITVSDNRLTPVSTGAQVYDCTQEALEGVKEDGGLHIHYCISDRFYKAYKVIGYDGDRIDVNLERISEELGLDPKNLDLEAYARKQDVKITKSREADTVTLTISDQNHTDGSPFNAYEIYVVDTMKVKADNATAKVVQDDISKGGLRAISYGDDAGLIIVSTAATVFFLTPPRIYCAKDATEQEKSILLNEATRVYQSIYYRPIYEKRPVCDESYLTYVSRSKISLYNEICHSLLGQRNNIHFLGTADPKDRMLWLGFECFDDFKDEVATAMLDEEVEASRKDRFFFRDEFGFDNFTSPYTGRGLCMGMSRVAAEVYNDETVRNPADHIQSGLILDKYGNEINYNIEDGECIEWTQTFLDKYISDYEFGKELNTEARDEDEVIKMLTWYWADGNERLNTLENMPHMIIQSATNQLLSWETVERAVERLDQDEVLLCGININNKEKRGHIINLVDYVRLGDRCVYHDNMKLNIDDAVRFMVYDCNFHNNFGFLTCYKYTYPNGKSILLYEYEAPKSGGERRKNYGSQYLGDASDLMYLRSVEEDGEHEVFFVIATEDLEVLNVSYR